MIVFAWLASVVAVCRCSWLVVGLFQRCAVLVTAAALLFAGALRAQDRTILFSVTDPGVTRSITNWGLDTAWFSEANIRRGVAFMGAERVDVVRISFTPTAALVGGDLQAAEASLLNQRLNFVDLTGPNTTVCINEDSPTTDAYFKDGSGYIVPARWAELIEVTTRRAQERGRTVVAVAPFNEPDLYRADRLATQQTFYNTAGELLNMPRFSGGSIRISGGNTLNTDQASPWYNFLKARLEEGNTHQLAGSFDNYAGFFQNVKSNGHHPSNDELHNVMEAMVGAEYGLQTGIWWGTAERARGEFVKASDGHRLGYAEHRPNWTAAAVYRGTNGAVQAFVGESERQARPTVYRFFSRDRDVFYDGHGPQREYTATTTGGAGYQTTAHRNAERVINITWGADVQPAIGGRYIVVNRNSGKVLQVPGSSLTWGVTLTQNTYTNGNNQLWDVYPLASTNGGDYSYHTLKAVHSGATADNSNFSFNDGNAIIQYGTGGNEVQHWYLEYVGNGYFRIRNRWSGKCLEVSGTSTANGASIVQWSALNRNSQQWRLLPVGAAVEFVAPAVLTGVTATANAVSVQLNWNASATADLAGYMVLRATSSGGPYEIVARGVTNNAFTDKSANEPRTYFYVVKATDRSLNTSGNSAQVSATPTGNLALIARYTFDATTNDSSGNANHPIITSGTPIFVTGKYGSALDLNGTSQYTMLPANMLASVTNFTLAVWVNWDGGAAWQRIFDFGNDTMQNMFLTPSSGGGKLRFAITTNSYSSEQFIETSPLPTGQWYHVAVTRNGNTARLYTNGVLAASTTVTIAPADFNPALNFLGKSQYADPLFNGRLDELFIYNYALSATEITRLAANQPPPSTLPAGISHTFGDGNLTLSWPADHTGWRLEAQTNSLTTGLGTNWVTVPNSDATNLMVIPIDAVNDGVFFRLVYP